MRGTKPGLRTFALFIGLWVITIGSLAIFAVLVNPIESKLLSVALGFGGWVVWCLIVLRIFIPPNKVNQDGGSEVDC